VRRVIRQWGATVRAHAAEFGQSRGDLVRDWLFGTAAIAVVLLDLVALAAVTTGGGR